MGRLDHDLAATIDPDVADVLAAIGRTEDLRFSPDGRRLALAGFAGRTVVLVEVAIAAGPTVAVEGVAVLTTDLRQPHGLDWLDADTLVVGDRGGGVALLVAPAAEPGVRAAEVTTTPVPLSADLVRGPGSVAVVPGPEPELLVCGNWADAVTRHRIAVADPAGAPVVVVDEGAWLRRSLDLPDGVAVSGDGRWVAVSNHGQQLVLVYDRAEEADPDERRPIGILRGSCFPHGLRFTPDGRHLLVADAGAPFVHVHDGTGGWDLAGYPDAALRVLDDATFAAGHGRPDEGGPKGVDIDPTGCVLALTNEHRPLAFVDLGAARQDPAPPDAAHLAAYERGVLDRIDGERADRDRDRHDALAAEAREHDARALAARTEERAAAIESDAATAHAAAEDARRRAEAAEHRAADAEAHLAAVRATRLWRAAEGPRRLYARLRPRP